MTAILTIWAIVSVFMFIIMIVLPTLEHQPQNLSVSTKRSVPRVPSRRLETAQPQT